MTDITILPLNKACKCMHNFENGIQILTLRRRQATNFHTTFYRNTFEKKINSVKRGTSNTVNSRSVWFTFFSVFLMNIFRYITWRNYLCTFRTWSYIGKFFAERKWNNCSILTRDNNVVAQDSPLFCFLKLSYIPALGILVRSIGHSHSLYLS